MLTFSLVSLAVMVTSIRVVLPALDDNVALFQEWTSEKLGKEVQIGQVNVSWLDNKPALRFQQVLIKDPDTKKALLDVGDVFLVFRPIKSLFQLEPIFGTITLTGLHLSASQSPVTGSWHIRGFDSLVDESDTPSDSTEGIQELLAWLADQSSVRVKSSSIEWRKNDRDILPVYIEELSLQNQSDRHEVLGKFLLALNTPSTLTLTSTLTGDLLSPEDLTGHWYANLTHAKLKEWQAFAPLLPENLDGLVDIHSWGEINESDVIETDWDLTAENLVWNGDANKRVKRIGLLHWKSNLRLEDEQLTTQSQLSAKLNAETPILESLIQTDSDFSQDITQHNLFISQFNLNYLQPLVGLIPASISLPANIGQLETNGHLENLALSFKNISSIKLSTKLNQVALYQTQSGQDKQGFSGLSGDFYADSEHAALHLKSDNLQLSMPAVFPNSLEVGNVDGKLHFTRLSDTDWQLSSQAIELHPSNHAVTLSFQYDKQTDAPAHLSYLAFFNSLDEGILDNHLPENIMGAKLPTWLRKAIQSLSLTNGRSLFHGPVNAFPFELGDGVFQTEAMVDNLTLAYSDKWPQIDNGKGTLGFNDASLGIQLDEGQIAGMQIDHCHGHIENLERDSLLELDGRVSGAGKDLTYFIHSSPLKSTFGEKEDDFVILGPTEVTLKLEQPLGSSTRPFDLDGILKLTGNQLELLEKDWVFSDMVGDVSFKHNAVSSDKLTATFLDSPVMIQLGSARQEDNTLEIRAQIAGDVEIENLEKRYQHPLLNKLTGRTEYRAQLKLKDNQQGGVNTQIEIESDLVGVEVALPSPLGKSSSEAKPLKSYLDVFPARQTAQIDVHYAADAKARLLLGLEKEATLNSLVLSMGGRPIQGRPKAGFFLRGQVPELDIEAWQPIVREFLGHGEKEGALEMNELKLEVQRFEFLGSQFTNLKLEAMPKSNAWDLYVDSPKATGIIEIPKQSQTGLMVNLKTLKLDDNGSGSDGASLKPADIPKMQVKISELFFDEKPLGQLTFSYHASSPNLVNINDILLEGTASTLNAKLQWMASDTSAQTKVQFTFDAEDVQKAVKDWGADTGMIDTKGQLSSELQWPGSPADFGFADLEGSVALDLQGGRLEDVDPGAARLFGLWSLQTLTRRLTLDFSDLYKKGLSFDSIKGQFKLQEGNAYTCDTRLVSPSTRVEIKGRTGLVKQDFEQVANVALSITDPVPYIVAVFNPIAGALTWLGSKAFEKAIDKMTGVRYLITGPWDEPEVQPLGPILKEAAEALPGIGADESDYAKSAKRIESFESFCLQ